MSIENFKISIGDVIKLFGFLSAMAFQWYSIKMEIREQFLQAGFEAEKTKQHFILTDADIAQLKQATQMHDVKFARIFTILSKEFDKPKKITIQPEE